MNRTRRWKKIATSVWLTLLFVSGAAVGQEKPAPAEKIIIDTDIGDDIDDAFAVALALRSPEVRILGITTAFGDTEGRAKIVDRFLAEAGREDIPVAVGRATPVPKDGPQLPQRRYGELGHFARTSHAKAVDFLLDEIRRHPNEITLIGIGPLVNVGDAIDRDPATFRKLKRVVIMGGSVTDTSPEWNIRNDPVAAQKLLASGVPVFIMPLEATVNLRLYEERRRFVFEQATPITDSLTLLYYEWLVHNGPTPTLYDPMAVAYAIDSSLCPVEPMRLSVDDRGGMHVEKGEPNAQVCPKSNSDDFFRFYLGRLKAD